MKKNLILGMFAAAGMLLASSCQNDELETTLESGGAATVSFSVSLESGAQTRAISDGNTVNELIFAVYKDGELIKPTGADENSQLTATLSNGTGTASVTLAKEQEYTVLFWAQKSGTGYYTTTDLTAVKVNYTGDNNDENRDAFYKAETFTVTGSGTIEVTLKRPFAQINVGVTADDWTAAVNSGATISTSTVTISDVADVIDLSTGSVSKSGSDTTEDDTDDFSGKITYTAGAIPDTGSYDLSVDVDGNGEIGTDEKYYWLSMSYILVNDSNAGGAASSTTDASFTFTPSTGEPVTLDVSNIPVQRNYRTNILGKILTGDLDFDVVIDKGYINDNIYPSTLAEELLMVAANGGTVTLTENVVLDEPLTIAEGKTVVINLNGYSITYSTESSSSAKRLTKADGTAYLIQVEADAKLEINGEGEVGSEGGTSDIYVASSGTLTINGGTYYGTLTCEDGGAISITGGTFYKDPSSYYAQGYKVETITVDTETYYMVVEQGTSVVTDASSLKTALADENTTSIVVHADTDLTEATASELTFETAKTIEVEEGVTITLGMNGLVAENGLTLTGGGTIETEVVEGTEKTQVTMIYAEAGECVIDGVTLNLDSDYHYHGYGADMTAVIYQDAADITIRNSTITSGEFVIYSTGNYVTNTIIENCTFESTSSTSNGTKNYSYALDLWASYVTINDCTIKGIQGAVGLGNCVAEINGGTYYTVNSEGNTDAYYAVSAYDGAYVFITDGKFSSPNDRSSSSIDIGGTSSVMSHYSATLFLYGGQYSGKAYDIDYYTNSTTTYSIYEPEDGYEWQALEGDTSGLNLVWEVVPSASTAQQSLAARRPTLNTVKSQLKIESVGRQNIR